MNTTPALSPEAAAWMQAQMVIATAQAVAPLRREIDQLDDWANGLFLVLADILPPLLRSHPEVAGKIAPHWQRVSETFETLKACGRCHTDDGEPLEQLEARKMLYGISVVLGALPLPGRG